MAEICKEMGVQNFVHLSALGASDTAESEILRSKAAGERAVLAAFPEATIVRPATLIGPEDKQLNWNAMVYRQLGFSPVFFDSKYTSQPVYVGDVATAIRTICQDAAKYEGKVVEMFGNEKLSQQDMVDIVADEAEFQPVNIVMPGFLSKLFGQVCDWIPDHFVLGDLSLPKVMLYAEDLAPSGDKDVLTLADMDITPKDIRTVGKTWLGMWNRGTPFNTNIPDGKEVQ